MSAKKYFVALACLVKILDLLQSERLVEKHALVFGEHLKCLVVVLDGLADHAEILACDTSELVGIRNERIVVNGYRGILFSTLEIIEIELGECSEEIGLCEVRLGRNDLIKILYRKDIILEVESVAADLKHLVSVDLRLGGKT